MFYIQLTEKKSAFVILVMQTLKTFVYTAVIPILNLNLSQNSNKLL
jgi:hypothetical protein